MSDSEKINIVLNEIQSVYGLTENTKNMLEIDVFASDLYESIVTEMFKTPFINELQQSMIKI